MQKHIHGCKSRPCSHGDVFNKHKRFIPFVHFRLKTEQDGYDMSAGSRVEWSRRDTYVITSVFYTAAIFLVNIFFIRHLCNWTSKAGTLNHVYMYSFSVTAKYYIMMSVMTTSSGLQRPLRVFLFSFLTPPHRSPSLHLLYFFWLFFCPSLWAPLQFTGRANSQQTNTGPGPSPADRKQSGRAEQEDAAELFRMIPPQRLLTVPLWQHCVSEKIPRCLKTSA